MGTRSLWTVAALMTVVVWSCSSDSRSTRPLGGGTDDGGAGDDAAAPDGNTPNDGEPNDGEPSDGAAGDPPIPGSYAGIGAGFEPDAVVGPDAAAGYVVDGQPAEGVATDADGRLVLAESDGGRRERRNHLWVSNSQEETVSSIDTDALREVGRYYVGVQIGGEKIDPSRTSVDLAGDVFVGNRGSAAKTSVTKIVGDATSGRCIDRNDNGVIETSTGPADIKPRAAANGPGGQVAGASTDECVVWTRVFAGEDDCDCLGIRAVAATAEAGESFDLNGHVWVGCRDTHSVFKLHGTTGEILDCFPKIRHGHSEPAWDAAPYGFVLDGQGRLWISGRGGGGVDGVYWLDVAQGVAKRAGVFDDPYGIAVDGQDHVWVAKMRGEVWRFRPGSPPEAGEWEGIPKVTDRFRGIAVDIDGYVFAIDTSGEAQAFVVDPKTFPDPASVSGPYSFGSSTQMGTGVAIDFTGHVWGISTSGCGVDAGDTHLGCASRLTADRSVPGALSLSTTPDMIPVGLGLYVYSDMIGYSLLHFAAKEGWYRQVFEVCEGEETRWDAMAVDAETPAGTRVGLRARTAASAAELDQAAWFPLATLPDDPLPALFPDAFPRGRVLELEVRLRSDTEGASPSVGHIGFRHTCAGGGELPSGDLGGSPTANPDADSEDPN